MKLIFIDTEFTDFINTELISLGAITEDGSKEFYVEINDYNRKASSEFVRNVVEPQLQLDIYGKNKLEAGARFGAWLDDLDEEYALCPDYQGDWDLVTDLVEIFPPWINSKPILLYPELRRITLEKAQELQTPNLPWFFDTAETKYQKGFLQYFSRNHTPYQHHALADAKANRYGWLKAIEWLNSHTY